MLHATQDSGTKYQHWLVSCQRSIELRIIFASSRTEGSGSALSARSASGTARLESSRPSAHSQWLRMSGSLSFSIRSMRAGTDAVAPTFAATTAALRSSPRRLGRVRGVPRKRSRNSSSLAIESTSTTSSRGPTPASGWNSGHRLSEAKRLNGHTS